MQTNSPHTVDVGHVILETDLWNHTTDNGQIPAGISNGLFYFNLKVGFHKNMDVSVLSDAYTVNHFYQSPTPATHQAFPDFTFRYKVNVLANDSGKTSISILPFVTSTNFLNEKAQLKSGGIFVNIERKLRRNCALGYTGGLSEFSVQPFFKQHEWFSAISFTYPVYKSLNHFVEVTDRLNTGLLTQNKYSFDSGFTFTPAPNNQFDMGFYYFIPVKTLYVFVGTSIRI